MYRATTPTLTLTMPQGFSFDDAEHVYVTVRQGPTSLTKNEDALYIENNTVEVYLEQTETLAFSAGSVMIQLNVTYAGGQRFCTDIVRVNVKDNLIPEVLE